MADCSQIGLMLGAFDDGALEPHESQEVAFHLARCEMCTAELAAIADIGRELRTAFEEPPLDGFKDAVMARIAALPVPISHRIARFFGRLSEQMSAGIGMAAAAAAAAVITAFMVGPLAQNFAQNRLHHAVPVSQIAQLAQDATAAPAATVGAAQEDLAAVADDSHAVISRLESEIPSVAVWSEPQNDTTVIWLPDQQ